MTGVVLFGVAAAGLDDRQTAATIHRILEPYAGQLVVCGNAVATIGPVDHYLALLAGRPRPPARGRTASARRRAHRRAHRLTALAAGTQRRAGPPLGATSRAPRPRR